MILAAAWAGYHSRISIPLPPNFTNFYVALDRMSPLPGDDERTGEPSRPSGGLCGLRADVSGAEFDADRCGERTALLCADDADLRTGARHLYPRRAVRLSGSDDSG